MPIYEYRCHDCSRRSSLFVRSIGSTLEPVCSHCGSREMSRLFSRVAVLRSEDDLAASLTDEAARSGMDENDPRGWARWIRRMSQQMGEPLDPKMQADLERMEAGEPLGEEGEEDEEGMLEEA